MFPENRKTYLPELNSATQPTGQVIGYQGPGNSQSSDTNHHSTNSQASSQASPDSALRQPRGI
jgi:hypothetical protein